MKVLVCEDDKNILSGLTEILQREGYEVFASTSALETAQRFKEWAPTFVILDVMMPEMSGYDLCRFIRSQDAEIPIMFISARTEEIDRVIGLELGADDYLVKPFGVNEVLSRIRAITRRCYRLHPEQEPELREFRFAHFRIRPDELKAFDGERVIELSLRDIKLLKLFAERPGKVIDRDTIFNHCWGMNYLPNSRTLDQHISKLRKKLSHTTLAMTLIETVHGVGYRHPE